jgi:aminoglycoside phosphotransferase (APT) family kinase protein
MLEFNSSIFKEKSMARSWESEYTVEPNVALALIKDQFPGLLPEKIKLLGIGWDNTAYLINDTFVFRFPRRTISLPLLNTELHVLPKIASRLPLAIPYPEWAGSPAKGYPWSFTGYRMMPGITACSVDLSEDERIKLTEPLARFLAALHAIPISPDLESRLQWDVHGKLDADRVIRQIKINLEELDFLGLLEKRNQFDPVMEQKFRTPLNSTIVHGDFYVRHLLVDENRRVSGVIDWGDVHIGDPAVDLSIAHSFLPSQAHDKFRAIYGEISKETWELARLRALYHSSILAIYGHHSQDEAIRREGLRSLKKIAELQ